MSAAIVWFRQDLRLHDNPALHAAIKSELPLIFLYIYDNSKKNKWACGGAQQWWLHHSLAALENDLKKHGAKLVLHSGEPLEILKKIVSETDAKALFYNRCYEPYAIARDTEIKKDLGITVNSYNGALLVEPWEMKTKQGGYFKVYTPFWKQFRQQVQVAPPLMKPRDWKNYAKSLKSDNLDAWGLLPTQPNWAKQFEKYHHPGEVGAHQRLETFLEGVAKNYASDRDFPALNATSNLSAHLHFGEISPRQIWHAAFPHHEKFLSEVVWREFAHQLLFHFPQLPEQNFQDKFNQFPWSRSEKNLARWQQGETGYPIVDAGMRQLWQTGIMHNRVRMIVGSFLTKDLLLHWHHGQAWFWDTLVDADLANNAFGWQWIAGSGADAAPYFRVFNPTTQAQKFDADGEYIKQWVPELAKVPSKFIHTPWEVADKINYPPPMVDHDEARKRALAGYEKIRA